MKRGKSYEWIPLWIDKWLMGSTRFELKPEERSVFVDLMALGAKDDGFIRANSEMGYPHDYLAHTLNVTLELLETSIAKCIQYRKIEALDNGVYRVVNWEEYRLSGGYKRALTIGIKPMPGMKETDIVSKETESVSLSMSKSMSPSHSKNANGISFDDATRSWVGITKEDKLGWAEAYPACDVDQELAKMREWILGAGARGKKRAWRAFIVGWLKRTQAAGGTRGTFVASKESRVGANPKRVWTHDEWVGWRRSAEREVRKNPFTEKQVAQAMEEWDRDHPEPK